MGIYYKKMAVSVKICYLISAIVFALTLAVSAAAFLSVNPQAAKLINSFLAVFSGITVVIAGGVISAVMSKSVISCEYGLRANGDLMFSIKRIGLILLYTAGGVVVSILVGGRILSALLGLGLFWLRSENFAAFSFIVKAVMYVIFLFGLAALMKEMGHSDTSDKGFNPHMTAIAILLALSFLMPYTVYDHLYENEDVTYSENGNAASASNDEGKIRYNLQSVFSKNENLFEKTGSSKQNQKFSIAWVILSILLSSALQLCVVLLCYSMGRKKYYKQHPRLFAEHFPEKV